MAQSNNKAAQEMAAAHATAVQEAKDKRVLDNEAISAGNAAATEAATPAAAAAPSAPSTSTAATAAAAAAAAATEDEDAMPGFDDAPTDIITATDEDDVADMIASARAADEVAINGDSNPNVDGNPYPNPSLTLTLI